MGGERPKPDLRLVDGTAAPPPKPRVTLDRVTRASHVKMVRHLARRYGLQMLVDQTTFGVGDVSALDDDALVALHRDLDRARECIADGIPLEDAGLIRSTLREA